MRWLTLHVPTQVAATGETRDDALDELDARVERFTSRPHNDGVTTAEDILGGAPRLDHTRIGVEQVRESADAGRSLPEIAASFEQELSIPEVEQALDWADENRS
ncbi:DUF433 domain-containing protein [Salinigranum salinum]|uniref:DUF433 domain-containing protein n=1 Tax=Salinigranum salinum TaxID=1364937 RepID=UPI00374356A6